MALHVSGNGSLFPVFIVRCRIGVVWGNGAKLQNTQLLGGSPSPQNHSEIKEDISYCCLSPRALANGNKVYDVGDPDTGQKFIICLDDEIRADLSKSCELTKDTLFICRDIALDDSAAANLALQCRLKTI